MSANKCYKNVNIDLIIERVAGWHRDRNLVDGSTDKAQFVKLVEETGELAANIARGQDIRDSVGDVLTVLINICERNDVSLKECLSIAWDDIKDRKGKMVDGVFIKEADL